MLLFYCLVLINPFLKECGLLDLKDIFFIYFCSEGKQCKENNNSIIWLHLLCLKSNVDSIFISVFPLEFFVITRWKLWNPLKPLLTVEGPPWEAFYFTSTFPCAFSYLNFTLHNIFVCLALCSQLKE